MKELEAMKRYDSFDFMYFHEVIRIVELISSI